MRRGVVGGLSRASVTEALVMPPAAAASDRLQSLAARVREDVTLPGRADIVRRLFGAGELGGVWDARRLDTLWQDNAGTVPVTAPGDPVGRWDSLVRGVSVATPDTARRPLWQTDGTAAWLDFDGVDDVLWTQTPVDFSGRTDALVGVACRRDKLAPQAVLFHGVAFNAETRIGVFSQSGTLLPNRSPSLSLGALGTTIVPESPETVRSLLLTGRVSRPNGWARLQRNGTDDTPVSATAIGATFSSAILAIGARVFGTTTPDFSLLTAHQGRIHGVILRMAPSSAAEQALVDQTLRRWANWSQVPTP
jgi:hypothetical protein